MWYFSVVSSVSALVSSSTPVVVRDDATVRTGPRLRIHWIVYYYCFSPTLFTPTHPTTAECLSCRHEVRTPVHALRIQARRPTQVATHSGRCLHRACVCDERIGFGGRLSWTDVRFLVARIVTSRDNAPFQQSTCPIPMTVISSIMQSLRDSWTANGAPTSVRNDRTKRATINHIIMRWVVVPYAHVSSTCYLLGYGFN